MKRLAAAYFMSKPELLLVKRSQEEQIAHTKLLSISVYRNGDASFLLDMTWADADLIIVYFKADGSREITYHTGERETFKECCEKL